MLKKILVITAWVVAYSILVIGCTSVLTGLLEWLDFRLIAQSVVILGFSSVVILLVGIGQILWRGFQGNLPGLVTKEGPAPSRKSLNGLINMASIGIIAASLAAIAGAVVSDAYGSDARKQRISSGEVDWIMTIESESLRETRDLRIELPLDYDKYPDRRYPVLLVLDAGHNLGHTTNTVEVLSLLGMVEPMIVVGVVNGPGGREADFVPPGSDVGRSPGRADRFLEFIENEVLPMLDQGLRTNSTRLIAGHSLGGLFVTYTLLERPEMFAGRFAFSPSWWVRDQHLVGQMEAFFNQNEIPDSYFYTNLGRLEGGDMLEGFSFTTSVMENHAPSTLFWESEVIENADHGDTPERSTPRALQGFGRFYQTVLHAETIGVNAE